MPGSVDLEEMLVRLSADLRSYESAMRTAHRSTDATVARIERRFEDMNRRLQRSAGRLADDLKRAIAAAGVGIVAREALQAADGWTRLENQLAAAGVAQGRVNDVMDENVAIARRSRSELDGTINLYARLLRSTRQLGIAQTDVARATEIVNKAFVAGGAAPTERAAGTLQLSQGLASGFLQGDELRSIRENAPLLAQAIADEFGVTIGQLKQLGAEGQLTTDRLVSAILNGGDAIERQFAATRMTVSDAFTALRTETARYIASFDDATGVTEGLAAAISGVADNIELFGDAAVVVAATVGGLLAGRAMVQLVGQLTAATTGLAATTLGITRVTGASRAATAAMIALRGGMAFLGGPWVLAITAIATALGLMITAGRRADERMRELDEAVQNLRETLGDTEDFLSEGARSLEEFANSAGVAADAVADIGNAMDDLPENADPMFRRLAAQMRVVADRAAAEESLAQYQAQRDAEAQRLAAESIRRAARSGLSGPTTSPRLEELDQKIAAAQAEIAQATLRLEDLAEAADENFIPPENIARVRDLREELARLTGDTSEQARLLREELAKLEEGGLTTEEDQLKAQILRVKIEELGRPARDALAADQQKVADVLTDLQSELDNFGNEQQQFIAQMVSRLPDSATAADREQVAALAEELFRRQQDQVRAEDQAGRLRDIRESVMTPRDRYFANIRDINATYAAVFSDLDERQRKAESDFAADPRATSTVDAERRQANDAYFATYNRLAQERQAAEEEYARAVRQVSEELERAEYYERKRRLYDSSAPADGAVRALEALQETAGDAATVIEDSIVRAFRGAEDAIAEFVKTGKLDFKSLVASIIADIAVLTARAVILGPIAGAIGGWVGNAFGSVQHSGGMAGAGPMRSVPAAAFMGAPRLHSGGGFGLRPDEHPAILQTGERVLNRRETADYNRGWGGGVNVPITIVTPNPQAFHASRVQVAQQLSRAVGMAIRGD